MGIAKFKEIICNEAEDLTINDRKKVLSFIKKGGFASVVKSAPNGSRIDLDKISDEVIIQIYVFLRPNDTGLSSDDDNK